MDLRSSAVAAASDVSDLESLLTPYYINFKQLEMGIECSAKGYIGLIDIISCAQKAVLFPNAPLHDSLTKTLKPEFERALLRVFRICDLDGDGYISDDELREFQYRVFQKDLQRQHITAFKEVLIAECEDFDETMAVKGITFEAFKAFQRIIIRKLKMDISWQILRSFGYNDNLELCEEIWNDHTVPQNELDSARSFELTTGATDFLAGLHRRFEVRNIFDQASAERVFMTNGEGCPFNMMRQTAVEDPKGTTVSKSVGVSVENWIALWLMHFNNEPVRAFRDLVYSGYQGTMREAIVPIFSRGKDVLMAPSKRSFFNVLVLGASGAGKTQFLD